MSGLDDLILLGKVTGTHGIKGELRVVCYSGEYDTLSGLRTFFLRGERGEVQEFSVLGLRLHGGKALVRLKGYDDINAVSGLLGRELLVRRDQLPELEDGEYYWYDLLGLRVSTVAGEELGTLAEIIDTGSNDVYVVRGGSREYLLPATEEVIREIDLTARTMTISPLEGLLDL